MRHTLLIISFLILPLAVMAQRSGKPAKPGTLAYLDEKNGFKTIQFGASIETIMDHIQEAEGLDNTFVGVNFYEVVDPDLKKVGDKIVIDKLSVGEFDGRIALILMDMGKPNGRLLNDTFIEAYGKGYQSNRYMDKYTWRSKNILMILDFDGLSTDTVIITDLKLYNEIEAYGSEQSKKAVDDI